jgi:hypothetical protein
MKNPFKEKLDVKVEPKPEIRQVIGYELNGKIYHSAQEARKGYILAHLKPLVWGHNFGYSAYNCPEDKETWEKLNGLFNMELPIRPLFTEPNV